MHLNSRKKAYLMLEDGLVMEGISIGLEGSSGGEICFNTGMTGYQEVYTDPSYFGQVIINTNAHIGNYGTKDKEQQSDDAKVSGIIVNEFSELHSRQTADLSLDEYLKKNKVVGISDIDTRKLVRHIRSKGAMNVVISSELSTTDELKNFLDTIPSMEGLELASKVTTKEPYFLGDEGASYKIAVLDYGIKKNILRNFIERDCYCKIFPAHTSIEEIENWEPDGYFLSNGPGDPASMQYAIDTAKVIIEKDKPLFGICLGHQLISLASGLETYKMHHGHRGLNHPVKNLVTGESEITSQNHGFAVNTDEISSLKDIELTHVNLNDDTVEGIKIKNKKVFSVQYHPESSPGPHDSIYLFDDFINMLK
ncbi:MAG: glutamine-hydrolyzing carbamoyl-phosphate synthase small subunit [Bacteroidota bacterium]